MAHDADNPWIEWNGGDCPVPTNCLVNIRFGRGHTGKEYGGRQRQDPLNWQWQHGKAPLDIVEYQVVPA